MFVYIYKSMNLLPFYMYSLDFSISRAILTKKSSILWDLKF